MERHRVLIVDDHPLARAALRTLVNADDAFEVVGEAVNGVDAVRAVGELNPDLVVMDLTMPEMNGIEATAEIKRRYARVRVVIVTMHDNEEYDRASRDAGADGYVLKDAGRKELSTAIRGALLD